jgi:hypothetical protein
MLLASENNTKIKKGEEKGYYSIIVNLAPADSAEILIDESRPELGFVNLCVNASPLCKMFCNSKAGYARINPQVIAAQIRRTRWLHFDREGFLDALRKDIVSARKKAAKLGLKLAVRINGSSDLYWLAKMMALEFPDVQFYDYTAHPKAWLRTLSNYHLTFSLKENNLDRALDALAHGINLAVVFPDKNFPRTWKGFEVLDGDETDLRFLEGYQGKVIALSFKDTELRNERKAEARVAAQGFIQIALAS